MTVLFVRLVEKVRVGLLTVAAAAVHLFDWEGK